MSKCKKDKTTNEFIKKEIKLKKILTSCLVLQRLFQMNATGLILITNSLVLPIKELGGLQLLFNNTCEITACT